MPLPFLGQAALAFAPMLLQGMLGRNDPQEKLRRQLMQLFSSKNIGARTGEFYNQFLQGPGYAGAQRSIAGASNVMQNQLGRNLGASGLRGSGVGALLPALGGAFSGSALGGLQTAGYGQARGDALSSIQNQANALQGVGPSPNYGNQLFGAGMDFLGPLIQQYLQQRGGGGGGGMGGHSLGSQNWLGRR